MRLPLRFHWTLGPLDRREPTPRRRHNLELIVGDPLSWLFGFNVYSYSFPGVYLHLGPLVTVGYFYDNVIIGRPIDPRTIVSSPFPLETLENNGLRLDSAGDRSRIVEL